MPRLSVTMDGPNGLQVTKTVSGEGAAGATARAAWRREPEHQSVT